MAFSEFGIVLTVGTKEALDVFDAVCAIISENGKNFSVLSNEITSKIANAPLCGEEEFFKGCDIIIVMGGDGTLLHIAVKAAAERIPVLGINLGHLGFLSALEKGNLKALEQLFTGDYIIDERLMLSCAAEKDGEVNFLGDCLNDIVISRGAYPRMIKFDVNIDGENAESYTADGIIIATPTGSTAYSLSAGGPIVAPGEELIIATPLCPHSLKSRSLVTGAKKTLEIELNREYNENAVVSLDGGAPVVITEGVTIKITKSELKTRLVRFSDKYFYSVLREKILER